MKKIFINLLVIFCFISLVGCSKSETKKEEKTQDNSVLKEVSSLYEKKISQINPLTEESDFTIIEIKYALLEMTNDDIPELLITRNDDNGLSDISVTYYDNIKKELVDIDERLQEGVAGAGGYRGSLTYSSKDKNLLSYEVSSGSGDYSVTKVALKSGQLKKNVIEEGKIQEESKFDDSSYKEITWNDILDFKPLYDLRKENISKEDLEKKVSDIKEQYQAAAVKKGYQVITGTIMNVTPQELLKIQGYSDPNPGSSYLSQFIIIKYDSKLNITATTVDQDEGNRTSESSLALLPSSASKLAGEKVTIASKANDASWPSDTSLPLGEPTINAYITL